MNTNNTIAALVEYAALCARYILPPDPDRWTADYQRADHARAVATRDAVAAIVARAAADPEYAAALDAPGLCAGVHVTITDAQRGYGNGSPVVCLDPEIDGYVGEGAPAVQSNTLAAANAAALLEDHAPLLAYRRSLAYRGESYGVDLVALAAAEIGAIGSLVDALDGLCNYPCYDESVWSELEYERLQEAWGDYIATDLVRDAVRIAEDAIAAAESCGAITADQAGALYDRVAGYEYCGRAEDAFPVLFESIFRRLGDHGADHPCAPDYAEHAIARAILGATADGDDCDRYGDFAPTRSPVDDETIVTAACRVGGTL